MSAAVRLTVAPLPPPPEGIGNVLSDDFSAYAVASGHHIAAPTGTPWTWVAPSGAGEAGIFGPFDPVIEFALLVRTKSAYLMGNGWFERTFYTPYSGRHGVQIAHDSGQPGTGITWTGWAFGVTLLLDGEELLADPTLPGPSEGANRQYFGIAAGFHTLRFQAMLSLDGCTQIISAINIWPEARPGITYPPLRFTVPGGATGQVTVPAP